MITIYDFINTLTNADGAVFRVFDCNSEDCLSLYPNDECFDMSSEEIMNSRFADYEIGGTDVWYDHDKRCIVFEFNIEYDCEDEEEYEERCDEE